MAVVRYLYMKKENLVLKLGHRKMYALAVTFNFLGFFLGFARFLLMEKSYGSRFEDSICYGTSYEFFDLLQNHKGQ